MNTYSPTQVAERLGTSRRRVSRAAQLAGLAREGESRVRYSEDDFAALARRLGVSRQVTGLTRIEALVLAELARRPSGLVSHRAIARACSISTASASKAVRSLMHKGLVTETRKTVALGRAREVAIVKANVSHPDWTRLLSELQLVVPADNDGGAPARLPDNVRHTFWNVDDQTFRHLDLCKDGSFIAARALSTGDANLMAFATSRLAAEAWLSVVNLRGLTPETRQSARNLAAAAQERATHG